MRRDTLLVALWLCLLPMGTIAANSTPDMSDTNYINKFVDDMVKNHEAAFVSACVVHSTSAPNIDIASIVFFPRKNKGMFIISDKNHVIFNWGDIDWTPQGQWDMGNLEGGVATIRILSDLFYKLTRLPFVWTSPGDVKRVLAATPSNSCELLKG